MNTNYSCWWPRLACNKPTTAQLADQKSVGKYKVLISYFWLYFASKSGDTRWCGNFWSFLGLLERKGVFTVKVSSFSISFPLYFVHSFLWPEQILGIELESTIDNTTTPHEWGHLGKHLRSQMIPPPMCGVPRERILDRRWNHPHVWDDPRKNLRP